MSGTTNEEIEALRKAMRGAQVAGKGQYVEDGRHQLVVDKALCKRSLRDGRWKESYIFEFKVIASSNPTHEVGSTRSYVENPENAGWLDRVKGCLAAVAGVPSDRKLTVEDEDTISDIIAALRFDEFRVSRGWPENFLKGRAVNCEGMAGTAQKSGKPVTNKKWEPLALPEAPAT